MRAFDLRRTPFDQYIRVLEHNAADLEIFKFEPEWAGSVIAQRAGG